MGDRGPAAKGFLKGEEGGRVRSLWTSVSRAAGRGTVAAATLKEGG